MAQINLVEMLGDVERERRLSRKLKSTRTRMARGVGTAFDRQATVFLRKLATLEPMFATVSEARCQNSTSTEAASNEVANWHKVSEASGPGSIPWGPLWLQTADETVVAMTTPIEEGAKQAMEWGWLHAVADLGVDLDWDVLNPRVVAYIDQVGAVRVANINNTTMEGIRGLISQSVSEGWSYGQTQKEIRSQFSGFSAKRPQAHIRNRAELITVTETGEAYSEGTYQVGQSLQDSGLVMEKRWVSIGDDRVDQDVCARNEAQGWINLNDSFLSGHNRPLGHPGCRCLLQTRRKEGAR